MKSNYENVVLEPLLLSNINKWSFKIQKLGMYLAFGICLSKGLQKNNYSYHFNTSINSDIFKTD